MASQPPPKPAAVVVVGSVNLDITLTVDRLPGPGETVLATDEVTTTLGGKGANQAVTSARQGVATCFVGAVADDGPGRDLLARLADEGLALGWCRIDDSGATTTGQALITVDARGANTIVVAAGANAALTLADVAAAGPALATGRVVLVQLEIPEATARAALAAGRASGAVTVLNPAPARPLDDTLLGLCDLLVPNEHEAAVLTGEGDPARAALALAERAPKTTVVVTCGGAGVVVVSPGGTARRLPAIPVTAVDSVAAGDAFCGALAAALASGRDVDSALLRAIAAGAHAVTVRGALPSLPTAADVDRLLSSAV